MSAAATPVNTWWPHLIIQKEPHNEYYDITVGNVPVPSAMRPAAFAFFQAGAVDRAGMLTPAGRALVLEGVRERLRRSGGAGGPHHP